MTQEQLIELSATLAHYCLEQSYLTYPYVTMTNGDVCYTEDAQDEFNKHYDTVQDMLKHVFESKE